MEEYLRKLGVNINVSFYLIFGMLIWVRILMMGSVIPFLTGKPVPRSVLVATSAALAIFIFPHIVPDKPPELSEDRLLLAVLFLKEIFYGLMMGSAVSVVFYAFESVGQLIDSQRGMSIARVLIPQLGEQGSISGLFLFQFGVVIYLALGGHLLFLETFFRSFIALPVLEFPKMGAGFYPLVDLFMSITGEVIYIALQMSMPVIIAIFFADLILGIMNRVAPQINVWELGFNIKGYIGVLLMFVSMTMIGEQMQVYENTANGFAADTVKMLQGKPPEGAPISPYPENEGLPVPEAGPMPVKAK